MTFKFKKYRILYNYNHSKMGFSNSITVEALNVDQALEKARHEVEMCYGTGMINKFSFKPDPVYSGVVI